MIGIVVAGYGGFAEHCLIALQVAKGKQGHICAVEIVPSNDPSIIEKNKLALLQAVASVDDGQGVLVCTDSMEEDAGLVAQSITQDVIVEVLSGVNLSMLCEIVDVRGQVSMSQAAEKAIEAARKSIVRHSVGPMV